MNDDLSDYLQSIADKPFAWGQLDCALFAAGWVEWCTGIDCTLGLRGRYRTQLGCGRLLKREGGLLALTQRGVRVAGLRPTKEPARGDVGVCDVVTTSGVGHAVGICVGAGRWAFLGLNGVLVTPAPHVAAWEF